MDATILFFGILPLIAFAVIDSFAGLKAGLISALIFAILETVYSLIQFGTLDWLTLFSVAMVMVFALISFKTHDAIFIKLQPVFLGICFGLFFLAMEIIGKPLLLTMLDKYHELIPDAMRAALNMSNVRTLIGKVSWLLGFGFIFHAGLVAYAAFRLNKWWWLIIRGLGIYIMMIICVLLARLI